MEKQENQPLWTPTAQQIETAFLTAFLKKLNLQSYKELHQWSVTHIEDFWREVWDFCNVISSQEGKRILEHPQGVFKPLFFEDARLNYAENLLRSRPAEHEALVFWGEDKVKRKLSYRDLYAQVATLAAALKSMGIQQGDHVAGYVPNTPETIIAMLAVTSLGALWSSCSPDFGVNGVLDRFGQTKPKILFMADGYYYKGKWFDCLEKIPALFKGLPVLEKIIVFSYEDRDLSFSSQRDVQTWEEILKPFQQVTDINFAQVPFNHPLFILYTSGTTGVPKCIVHRTGGVLLQHLKEHQLHSDIKPGDRVFYFTSCGWMMWNWLVSSLASRATLMLYDGCPEGEILWQFAEAEKITHFGTSAKYIDSLQKTAYCPKDSYDLTALRMILSTGSPLAPEAFDYVYEAIKTDLCLASISGGADIVSCFALGCPILPVWRGELQGPGLGMNVQVFDEAGKAVVGQKGELVCTTPFPSMPLYFWGDEGDQKYHATYFETYPNTWCHGDYAEATSHGGLIIYGRSDAVLNPGGVRIGTAEIYRQVEKIPEVLESLAVGQEWEGDVRVILFVVLRKRAALTDDLKNQIKQQIRQNASPRHVPAKIIAINEIPRTLSGKIVELAVRETIHGREVKNKASLANPEALEPFKNLKELQE
ncbi:MAG: acetoacetate--CoA ligase [Alphaproteobacteria bacterium]|nr:acetoacetate--CoA ligase [Alphaproteobacteria bacterium]